MQTTANAWDTTNLEHQVFSDVCGREAAWEGKKKRQNFKDILKQKFQNFQIGLIENINIVYFYPLEIVFTATNVKM